MTSELTEAIKELSRGELEALAIVIRKRARRLQKRVLELERILDAQSFEATLTIPNPGVYAFVLDLSERETISGPVRGQFKLNRIGEIQKVEGS